MPREPHNPYSLFERAEEASPTSGATALSFAPGPVGAVGGALEAVLEGGGPKEVAIAGVLGAAPGPAGKVLNFGVRRAERLQSQLRKHLDTYDNNIRKLEELKGKHANLQAELNDIAKYQLSRYTQDLGVSIKELRDMSESKLKLLIRTNTAFKKPKNVSDQARAIKKSVNDARETLLAQKRLDKEIADLGNEALKASKEADNLAGQLSKLGVEPDMAPSK